MQQKLKTPFEFNPKPDKIAFTDLNQYNLPSISDPNPKFLKKSYFNAITGKTICNYLSNINLYEKKKIFIHI